MFHVINFLASYYPPDNTGFFYAVNRVAADRMQKVGTYDTYFMAVVPTGLEGLIFSAIEIDIKNVSDSKFFRIHLVITERT